MRQYDKRVFWWKWQEANEMKCYYCDVLIRIDEPEHSKTRATIDHIVPKHAGGTDDFKNLVACCNECNGLKAGRVFNKKYVLEDGY